MSNLYLVMIFPTLMAFAGIFDFLSMRIPNRLSLVIIASFFLAAFIVGLAPATIAAHLLCAATALTVGFFMFSMGWIGGGDAKLFSAAALWLGWTHIASYMAITAIAGGVLAAIYLVLRLLPGWGFFVGHRLANSGHSEIPYGVALATAALIVYPHSMWAQTLLVG